MAIARKRQGLSNERGYPPDRLRALSEEEARRAGAELGLKPRGYALACLTDSSFLLRTPKSARLARLSDASARQPAIGRSSLTRPPTVAMKLAENAPISSDMNAHSAT